MLSRFQRALLVPLLAALTLLGAAFATPAVAAQSGTLSQTEFNLGDVPVGGSAVRSVQLTSTGTEPLTFQAVDAGTSGGNIALFSPSQYDPLAPGASREFTLAVQPWSLGPVDATLLLEYGTAESPQSIPVHVTYTAVAPPVLPYQHFDLRLDDYFWIALLERNATLRPIGGATGSTPGPFVFPVASGTVSETNTGVLSSDGGLALSGRRPLQWKRIGLDLTGGHLTAVTSAGKRVTVADLSYISDGYDLLGNRTTDAFVYLTAASSAMLNAGGLQTEAGQYIGYFSILKA